MGYKKLECYKNCQNCPSFNKSVFSDSDPIFLEEMQEHKTSTFFKKGQTLFLEGNPSFGLYCVGQGAVKVSKVGGEGKESIVRIASGGETVGHRSIFANGPYQATATSLLESHICFIDKGHVLKMAAENPKFASQMLKVMAKSLGISESRLADFSQKNVRERVAGLLLFLNDCYGIETDEGPLIDIKLTREEMGALAGTATETLIRYISELKDEKIVEQMGKKLVIKKMDQLEEFAGI